MDNYFIIEKIFKEGYNSYNRNLYVFMKNPYDYRVEPEKYQSWEKGRYKKRMEECHNCGKSLKELDYSDVYTCAWCVGPSYSTEDLYYCLDCIDINGGEGEFLCLDCSKDYDKAMENYKKAMIEINKIK